jgi:hypothetical protein
MNERCERCRWWDTASGRRGLCRVNPPTSSAGWPFTEFRDWCGRFDVKPGAATPEPKDER